MTIVGLNAAQTGQVRPQPVPLEPAVGERPTTDSKWRQHPDLPQGRGVWIDSQGNKRPGLMSAKAPISAEQLARSYGKPEGATSLPAFALDEVRDHGLGVPVPDPAALETAAGFRARAVRLETQLAQARTDAAARRGDLATAEVAKLRKQQQTTEQEMVAVRTADALVARLETELAALVAAADATERDAWRAVNQQKQTTEVRCRREIEASVQRQWRLLQQIEQEQRFARRLGHVRYACLPPERQRTTVGGGFESLNVGFERIVSLFRPTAKQDSIDLKDGAK